MTDPAKRERAALDVLELLPYRWALRTDRPTTPASAAGGYTARVLLIPAGASIPRRSPGRARTSWRR